MNINTLTIIDKNLLVKRELRRLRFLALQKKAITAFNQKWNQIVICGSCELFSSKEQSKLREYLLTIIDIKKITITFFPKSVVIPLYSFSKFKQRDNLFQGNFFCINIEINTPALKKVNHINQETIKNILSILSQWQSNDKLNKKLVFYFVHIYSIFGLQNIRRFSKYKSESVKKLDIFSKIYYNIFYINILLITFGLLNKSIKV